MKKLIALVFAVGVAAAGTTAAEARDGCGPGYHRGPYGHCRPNLRRGVVVAPGTLIVGNYYSRRGYWDGGRYWPHRYRYHNGWRYR